MNGNKIFEGVVFPGVAVLMVGVKKREDGLWRNEGLFCLQLKASDKYAKFIWPFLLVSEHILMMERCKSNSREK